MNLLRNLVRAEFYKLKHNKTFWVLFLLMALWGILYATLITLSSKGVISLDITGGLMITGPDEGPRFSETGLATFLITLRVASNPVFLSLLLGMFAGFFISNEYKTGVIKNVMSFGRRRADIFISKCVVFFFGVIVMWLIFPLISGGGAMVANGFNQASDAITLALIVRILSLAIVQLAAFSALLVFIGVMVEESGKAIILSIGIITGSMILIVILGNYFKEVSVAYEYTIMYQMINDVFNPTSSNTEIVRSLYVGFVTMIVFIFGGIGAFGRKEVK